MGPVTHLIESMGRNEADLNIDLGIEHHFAGGVYAKEMRFPDGYLAVQHKHNYDHMSILAEGKVNLMTDEGTRTITAPACIEIKAGVNHAIVALEPCVWFCIHRTDVTDPDKVDQVLIQES